MTATVITTDRMCEIILKPDNEFEKQLIEAFEKQNDIEIDTRFKTDESYGYKSNYKIHIFITNK